MSPLTFAVAAVIRDDAGRVLLCQQSQGHRLWGLPSGRIRPGENPINAVVREIRAESGAETQPIDLVGIYHLTGDSHGPDLPDVLVHVFRCQLLAGDIAVNAPGRICRLAWHDPEAIPEPATATARVAVGDALAGRSGLLRSVNRNAEPEVPDADDSQPATLEPATA